jgi:peptide/nickel transport system permease protein
MITHVIPNGVIPTLTLLGLMLAALVGGALVIENVFALPGMGSVLVAAFKARDFVLVQSITIVTAVGIVLINLVVDFLYTVIDPRVGSE